MARREISRAPNASWRARLGVLQRFLQRADELLLGLGELGRRQRRVLQLRGDQTEAPAADPSSGTWRESPGSACPRRRRSPRPTFSSCSAIANLSSVFVPRSSIMPVSVGTAMLPGPAIASPAGSAPRMTTTSLDVGRIGDEVDARGLRRGGCCRPCWRAARSMLRPAARRRACQQ